MCTIENILNFKLVSLVKSLNKSFEQRIEYEGLLYPHYAAMVVIHEHPGIRQMELAQLKATDRTTTGHTVDRLEELGFLERRTDEKDRRAYRLYLTPAGEEVVRKCWELQKDTEKDVLRNLEVSEIAQLNRLLGKALADGRNGQ